MKSEPKKLAEALTIIQRHELAALGKFSPIVAAPTEERASEARCDGALGSEIFLAATITGSNEQKGSEMPAEGKGERQSAGTVSGGSAQAPTISDQKQGTPAGFFPNTKPRDA